MFHMTNAGPLYMLSAVIIRSLRLPLLIFCSFLHIPHDLYCSFYMYYLLQNVGALWYFLTIQREDSCWHQYCDPDGGCHSSYLHCNNNRHDDYDKWLSSTQVFNLCNGTQPDPFNFGIYQQALVSGILGPGNFVKKLCYCFWWGLQNLRYFIAVVYEISHVAEFKFVWIILKLNNAQKMSPACSKYKLLLDLVLGAVLF